MVVYNPYALAGKTILVTGASSGIGRSVATEAARLGARIIVTGRNEERLQEVLSFLDGEGHSTMIADVTKDGDRQALVRRLPMLHGVSHNAGANKLTVFKYLSEGTLTEILKLNFTSTILMQREILKAKKMLIDSSIVFTASVASSTPTIGNCAYAASKGAVASAARVLALELAPKNIRVNCVSPGMVLTNLVNGLPLTEKEHKKNAALYPLGRYGQPEEVAWMICYLLSDAARWITGTDLRIDGGRSLL
jgi:NAD(P)-dependent dehydrogenase (short-subunit alcohol dehydrogenase family)